MTTDELQKQEEAVNTSLRIIAAKFENPITGLCQEETNQDFSQLVKEAKAWDKYFDILSKRYS